CGRAQAVKSAIVARCDDSFPRRMRTNLPLRRRVLTEAPGLQHHHRAEPAQSVRLPVHRATRAFAVTRSRTCANGARRPHQASARRPTSAPIAPVATIASEYQTETNTAPSFTHDSV